jgi:hypothetical protein
MAEIELTGVGYLKLQRMIGAMQSLTKSIRFSTDRR